MWLCPFKTVTEYVAVADFKTALQAAIFVSLFVGLVVVLPVLTGAARSAASSARWERSRASSTRRTSSRSGSTPRAATTASHCARVCPTFSLDDASIAAGRTRLSCSKCGKCVDECPRGAALFHVKGTRLDPSRRWPRLLFLYPAFLFLVTFGGGMIRGGIERLILLASTGSLLHSVAR